MSARYRPDRRWALALRIARRETTRARGRSILVLVMIALPVLGVTAADVVMQTAEVTGAEVVERRIGTADAQLSVERGVAVVRQAADPDADGWSAEGGPLDGTPGLADLESALGRELAGVELRRGGALVETDAGTADVGVLETDLTDDLTNGLYRMTEGRVPVSPEEVVVNGALAQRGIGLGDDLEVRNGPTLSVVGIGESTSSRSYPVAVSTYGGFELAEGGSTSWLVDAGGEVTWEDVQVLNQAGALVVSRAVLLDPPPASELPADFRADDQVDQTVLAVVALVVVMALMEVVLLAGPAFAVIARRMQRSLALMSAGGATPRQARRVVLATGLVLGAAGAALGIVLGLLVAWASLPVVQRFSSSYLGPYDVPWLHLVGIAGFGLLSALLAAVVPAWIASRQDVVAVLAGRRGEGRPSLRSPILGVVLMGTGVGVSVWGATSGATFAIAVAAVVTVLGMVLLVPAVVALVARTAGALPLPLRYAVRDASRHRTRTVPAVAAVAATVAGVVALGIGAASLEVQNQATYRPMLELGQASVTGYGSGHDWEAYRAVAQRYVPQAEVAPIQGVAEGGRRWTDVRFEVAGRRNVLSAYGSSLGTSVPISADGQVPPGVIGLGDELRAEAEAVLGAGGVLVFTDRPVSGDEATVRVRQRQPGPDTRTSATLPAVVVPVTPLDSSYLGVLSLDAATELGVEPSTVGLLVEGVEVTDEQEADVTEALASISRDLSFHVERGYQASEETVITLLVLFALGAALMLGGTLTATFLSLSDARPDLATLAAVGAAPRTRRAVAASYSLAIGLLGAVLGVLVGFVPGIAVTYPLTGSWVHEADPSLPAHFLDVPWLLVLGLVVVLPLFTAAVVGATTRSRLPLVARLD